jgi:hypothetical protein
MLQGPIPSLGTGTAASSLRTTLATDVGLPAGANFLGFRGVLQVAVEATFARPADTTAYASGDLVANNTTAGSVTAMSFTVSRAAAAGITVAGVRIRKTSTGVQNAAFRLHLYSTSPTVTNGDNGAWLSNQAAAYLGSVDVTMDKAFSDGACGYTPCSIPHRIASGSAIFGLLEARGAYTPVSAETFGVQLKVLQD